MCRATERARTFEFYLFGGDLDFPERYDLYISHRIQTFFDGLETDEEDIEYSIWEQGDKVLVAQRRFCIFNERNGELLIFSIDINNRKEGYFISLVECFKSDAGRVVEESCPVIRIR